MKRKYIFTAKGTKKKNSFVFLACIFFVFFAVNCCLAQNKKTDSLLTLLKTDKEDTNKVIHLYQLTRECELTGDYERGLQYGKESITLCEKLLSQSTNYQITQSTKKATVQSYNNAGNIYRDQANYPKALDYFLKALKIDEALNNKSGIAKRLSNIGLVHWNQDDFPKALDYFLKALKIDEELNNKKGIADRLSNIGGVYADQEDYPKALDYDFKALKITEELGNKNSQAAVLGNIGSVYGEQGESEKSKVKKEELLKKALDYDFKALKMTEELGNKKEIAINLGNIGSLYAEQKKYVEAETYLLDALKIDKETGAQDYERQVEELLSKLYETTGRHKEALLHYKNSILLKDSIFSAGNKKQMIKKEMNFEFEKKEAVAMAEHKSELEKQAAVAEEKSKKQKIVIWSVVGGLLLVVVFAGFIVRALRVTSKQKHIIELQKEEVQRQKTLVEEHHKEVMDSINYASRIQRALLPSIKYIENSLNRLTKIVSGN